MFLFHLLMSEYQNMNENFRCLMKGYGILEGQFFLQMKLCHIDILVIAKCSRK